VITKMARGSRTRGLVEYLFGPGRAEEHTNQRIVGAWDEAWVGITHPDEVQRALLTAEVDSHLKSMPEAAKPAEHVYHVSISNHGEDRNLTDTEWETVAETVAAKLGFTATEDRAGARWFAVHHGAASGDRDHIHFVATLVREDGRGIYPNKDKLALREVARELREQLGLEVRTREPGAGQPGLSRREVEAQRSTAAAQHVPAPRVAAPPVAAPPKRVAMPNQEQLNAERRHKRVRTPPSVEKDSPRAPGEAPRYRLARAVRAAATATDTEAQWLQRMQELGVQAAPRWEQGGARVVGYRVALAPTHPAHRGGQAQWFGGGKLAHDLTLPALRAGWRRDADPATAWRAVPGVTPVAKLGADPARLATAAQVQERTGTPAPGNEDEAIARAGFSVRSAARSARWLAPNADETAWAAAARDTAGLLAALAEHAPPGQVAPIAAAAAAMSGAGQVPHRQARGRRGSLGVEFASVASTVLAVHANTKYSTDLLLAQVLRLSRTIAAANEAEGRVLPTRHASAAVGLLQAATAPAPTVPAPATRVAMPNQQQLDAERSGTRRRGPHRGPAHDDDPGPLSPGLPTETDRGLGR